MSAPEAAPDEARAPPRVIGRVDGAAAGPLVVLVGGMHGNEPAGLRALPAVLDAADRARAALRGSVVALSGNRAALAAGRRYLDRDLNRRWSDGAVAALAAAPTGALRAEDAEQHGLAGELLALEREAPGRLHVIDLHTTSSESPPFVCFGDTLGNRRLALGLGLPAILGLEEVIDGAMLGWLTDRGHVAVAVEAGQHEDPDAAHLHTAAVLEALVAVGCLPRGATPGAAERRARLDRASRGAPELVEITHRHVCRDGDGFTMRSGFRSFQPVRRGELLATDASGEIRAGEDRILLMPRYQPQGEDGFFLARRVHPAWLGVSAVLRRTPLPRWVTRLPGVTARGGGTVDVDRRVARVLVRELMHLAGYRLKHGDGARLTFTTRAERET